MPLILRSQKGSNLTADEVDGNFQSLEARIRELEEGTFAPETLQDISLENGQLMIKGSKGSVFGPFDLPSAPLHVKGHWSPLTRYIQNDIVQHENALYTARNDHTSADTFELDAWETIFITDTGTKKPLEAPVYEAHNFPEPRLGTWAARADEDGTITPVFSNGKTWIPLI
jgi:hypothetical protein